ncbi:MAG TPA: radical SAM protein [Candidatus Hydrogenedentes bacterium]|nr:radical SAM protein [Candidatus Hydrogenedentota bacterium]HQH51432.1 radical SAM protein [Candidatus Hydrogenedentota bacterium]
MKLVFVNIMHHLYNLDSTASISQPPVPLGVLNTVTPKAIETALVDEQTDKVRFDGDVFAFTVATQFAGKVYGCADELRAAGKKVILGGIHVTVCPEEAMRHADAVVTGEAEALWPTICEDLMAGRLKERYTGSPTPSSKMVPVDYRFFAGRPYLTPASLFATRGCNYQCSFCVSSRYMGPFRTKPLEVLEQEIDQLQALYPGALLQFTDDNLLADREYGAEVLALVRRKKRRFVTMVTLGQLCDPGLMEEMAASGCLGVAVGVESVDDDNCLAVDKQHNVGHDFPGAVRYSNELGIQVAALLMVGLPLDTPERLARTQRYLEKVPCSVYDLRILRIYPGSSLYNQMLSRGDVTDTWWLRKEPVPTNHFLPGHLRVHLKHRHFGPVQLQHSTLTLTRELNRMTRESITHVLRVGRRGGALKFAAMALTARSRTAKQARTLLDRVEQAMTANATRDAV